jgi:hypothetical protein
VLGSAVHGLFQEMITPSLGRPLTPDLLRELVPEVRDRLTRILERELQGRPLERGHSRLRIDMAAHAIQLHLEQEAERAAEGADTVPLSLETELSAILPNGVRIKGRCDRIDRRNGTIHILDLKTGSVKDRSLDLKDVSRERLGADHGYALQLLIYAWAYMTMHPDRQAVRTGVIPLQRASRSEGIPLRLNGRDLITRDDLDAITALLVTLTDELLHGPGPFMHDPDSTYCTCCIP